MWRIGKSGSSATSRVSAASGICLEGGNHSDLRMETLERMRTAVKLIKISKMRDFEKDVWKLTYILVDRLLSVENALLFSGSDNCG
jgi:hypothetical protein